VDLFTLAGGGVHCDPQGDLCFSSRPPALRSRARTSPCLPYEHARARSRPAAPTLTRPQPEGIEHDCGLSLIRPETPRTATIGTSPLPMPRRWYASPLDEPQNGLPELGQVVSCRNPDAERPPRFPPEAHCNTMQGARCQSLSREESRARRSANQTRKRKGATRQTSMTHSANASICCCVIYEAHPPAAAIRFPYSEGDR
jgi:hypothetical protein